MGLSMERRFWKWIIYAFLGSALNMSIREKITKTGRLKNTRGLENLWKQS